MNENTIASQVFNVSMDIHKFFGPGLLEKTYEECLAYKLTKNGLFIEKQKPMPIVYEEVKLEAGYRVDMIVEHKVIVEVKAVEAINEIHLAQVLTYLKLSGLKLGLLINFNTTLIKNGFRRIINGYI